MRLALARLGVNARATGNTQLLGSNGFGENAIQLFSHGFVASLVAILLLDDGERHLARTEARHLDVLAHTLQALFHILLDIGDGDGEIDAAFQFVSLCSSCFHENSL